jgi:hypothetical protein
MSEEKKEGKQTLVSRRQVLMGTGMAMAAGAAASLVPKMVTEAVAATKKGAAAGSTKTKNLPLDEQVWDFEVPPPPISAANIKETITTDIVVVGSGAAGMPCAIAALETGAKVIVLKSSGRIRPLHREDPTWVEPSAPGGDFQAVNFTKKEGSKWTRNSWPYPKHVPLYGDATKSRSKRSLTTVRKSQTGGWISSKGKV